MVVYKEQKVQRGHAYAIVDEVDSILIDEARTPLIISGKGDKSTDLYAKADKFARTLKVQRFEELDSKEDMEDYYAENDIDYVVDEKQKTATLTQNGVKKAEEFSALKPYRPGKPYNSAPCKPGYQGSRYYETRC